MNIKINTNASQTDPMPDRHASYPEITIHHNVLVIAKNIEVLANLHSKYTHSCYTNTGRMIIIIILTNYQPVLV